MVTRHVQGTEACTASARLCETADDEIIRTIDDDLQPLRSAAADIPGVRLFREDALELHVAHLFVHLDASLRNVVRITHGPGAR